MRMAILSKSSTAYIGLAVFGRDQGSLLWELLIGLGMIAEVLFVLIADQFDPLVNLVEEQIFKKPLAWGQVMGFGSTCTSSWFAAIVSNIDGYDIRRNNGHWTFGSRSTPRRRLGKAQTGLLRKRRQEAFTVGAILNELDVAEAI